MGLVSPGQIAALRKVAYRGLETTTTTILRSIQVETDFGSDAQWATVDIDVPCWIRNVALTPNLTAYAMRETMVNTFRIHFESDVDIEIADRLVIEGSTLDVIDTNIENTYKIYLSCLGKKVE